MEAQGVVGKQLLDRCNQLGVMVAEYGALETSSPEELRTRTDRLNRLLAEAKTTIEVCSFVCWRPSHAQSERGHCP